MAKANKSLVREMALESVAGTISADRLRGYFSKLSPGDQTKFLKAVAAWRTAEALEAAQAASKPTKTSVRSSGAVPAGAIATKPAVVNGTPEQTVNK